MKKTDGGASKREHQKTIRWVITIFFITLLVSGSISLLSEEMLARSGMLAAFFILLTIVVMGILFDILGVAVTSAEERPFHSMAARKVPGAQEAIWLLRHAERVSSICNDVIGDICGVISGSASAAIAARMMVHFSFSRTSAAPLIMSALIAGITVGGKAIGKTYAINSCVTIVHNTGKTIHAILSLKTVFQKNRKR